MEPFTVTRKLFAKTIQKFNEPCRNKYINKLQLVMKISLPIPTKLYEI
jgi:hypothetical protein